jgi:hypothetical protein
MTVVYTALLGESDTLKPAPSGADRCVCVTDHPRREVAARGWVTEPWSVTAQGPRRDAWMIRCRPDAIAPGADVTVWIDASFTVLDLPALLRDAGDAALTGMRHPERSSCYEEGEALLALGAVEAVALADQLDGYRREGFAPSSLTTAGILARRWTPAVQAFNALWESEIHRQAGDLPQVTLDYCAWKVGLPIQYLSGTYLSNPYVRYAHKDHRRRKGALR